MNNIINNIVNNIVNNIINDIINKLGLSCAKLSVQFSSKSDSLMLGKLPKGSLN